MSGGDGVGIVGGGLLGLTVGLRLAQAGVPVRVYERAEQLGGLVGSFDLDGYPADRFYHVVLPTDDRVIGLARELGLGDRFRFQPTGVGFYDDGRLFSMSSLREFMSFPLLAPHDRVRLASFVARCQLVRDPAKLDDEPLLGWLRRQCGRRAVEALWRPLLDSKFDGRYDDLPASYIWARTRRMSRTRDASGRELMGWLEGGYQALVDALAARLEALGARIERGVAVERVLGTPGRVEGLVVDGREHRFDEVLCTLLPPAASRLFDGPLAAALPATPQRYLGVVCVILRVPESVSPYYTLNITDRRVPLTTVVESTHVVDPAAAGGTLLYVTRYVEPTSPDLDRPEDEVRNEYLGHARTIFPSLARTPILAASVQRARVVEPVHPLGGASLLPPLHPLPGLTLASTLHVYPEVVNGQAVLGVAERAAAGLLERVGTPQRVAA
ncbi:MAG: FAD-dependent oxidoreductase [Thermoleophilia bacterium]